MLTRRACGAAPAQLKRTPTAGLALVYWSPMFAMPFAGSPFTAMNPRTAPGAHRACGLTASVTATAEPPRAKKSARSAMTVVGVMRMGMPPWSGRRADPGPAVGRTVRRAPRFQPTRGYAGPLPSITTWADGIGSSRAT